MRGTVGPAVIEVVKDVLSIFGTPTMESMVWQLNQKGVSFAPSSFDIGQFEKELKLLMGEGSDIIMELIYQKLCERTAITLVERDGAPAIEKIRKLSGMTI